MGKSANEKYNSLLAISKLSEEEVHSFSDHDVVQMTCIAMLLIVHQTSYVGDVPEQVLYALDELVARFDKE